VEVNNLGQLAFINTSNGERTILDDDYPNLYQPDTDWSHFWYPAKTYSPDLTRIAYVGSNATRSETFIAIWDVDAKKELTTVSRGAELSIAPEMRPVWSSDSNKVIIQTFSGSFGNRERKLISIDKDGSILKEYLLNRDIAMMRYSLSPDQRKLAFWSPDPSSYQISNLRLLLIDLETGETNDFCIISPELSGEPVWSPESKHIVVELLMSDLENSEVVIIDLDKDIAVKIAENAKPIGWLK
jgi:Tol biopolymer transport system component